MEKITKREMYQFLSDMADNDFMKFPENSDINSNAVIDFCQNEIELLDKKAAKAKERAAKKAKEGDALTELVAAALTDEFQSIPDIAAIVALENEDATIAKVQYRLTQLVKNNLAEKDSITIAATETTKLRHVMGYRNIQPVGDNQ